MNPFAKRSDPLPSPATSPLDTMGPLDLTVEDIAMQPAFDQEQWAEQSREERGAGGRQVLAYAISIAAACLRIGASVKISIPGTRSKNNPTISTIVSAMKVCR